VPDQWNWINSAISASAGLGGVFLGGWLTSRREAQQERRRLQRDGCYLAALVVAHLDRFVDGCVSVACDDGTAEGLPAGGDGRYHEVTENPPTFDPLELNVDWKVLPPALMASILQLPFRIEQLERSLDNILQYDSPPDYPDFFYTRQVCYAEMGLDVSDVIRQLCNFAGLPVLENERGESNRDRHLQERRDKLRARRKRYEEHLANQPGFDLP
jgi:hypothetical protein